jgi:hypothetical protein
LCYLRTLGSNGAVDAKTLAICCTNLLAEAWIAPPADREAPPAVHTRAGLVRVRSRVQSQLHALLADLGIIALAWLLARQPWIVLIPGTRKAAAAGGEPRSRRRRAVDR